MQPQYIPTSSQFKDLTGQRFGRLVALYPVGKKDKRLLWLCRCDCGNEIAAAGQSLRSQKTKSCGCLHAEHLSSGSANRTHGLSRSRIYGAWIAIKLRCHDQNSRAYPWYGARGIAVCDEWQHDAQAFVDYVSTLPHYGEKGYTLDRIDNDGNYEPGNIRWATRHEQALNKRNPHPQYTYNGKTQSLTAWSQELDMPIAKLYHRICQLNWPIERAFSDWKRPEYTYNGKTQSLTAWAKELGIPMHILSQRMTKGKWSLERALTTPVRKKRR